MKNQHKISETQTAKPSGAAVVIRKRDFTTDPKIGDIVKTAYARLEVLNVTKDHCLGCKNQDGKLFSVNIRTWKNFCDVHMGCSIDRAVRTEGKKDFLNIFLW